ncbi:MAG: adenylate/guanylate cyclase domain-containing protein [Calditrichia bacterium]|nr:adenylate/guanylate cyclase domain-containing protein [Calditrichia bacterium]
MFKESLFKTALKQFAGKHIYNRILQHGSKAFRPGIKYDQLTAFVQYIGGMNRGWSAERFSPKNYLKFLSEYLTIMTECINDNGGIITLVDSNMIMAVWEPDVHHQYSIKATDCAIECLEQGSKFSERWDPKQPRTFYPQIGLSRGPLVMGNFGSKERLYFIAAGDAMNVAAALAKANRNYDSNILVSEFFKPELDQNYTLRLIDHIKMSGYKKPVKTYELITSSSVCFPIEKEILTMFDKGIVHYTNKKFKKAEFYFKKILAQNPDDNISRLYLLRCDEYMKNPPGENWDGIYRQQM